VAHLDYRMVQELLALRNRVRELIDRAVIPPSSAFVTETTTFEPPLDVWDSDAEVVVEAELPGVRSADVEVRLEGDVLTLSGTISGEADEGAHFLRMERPRGRFSRAIRLPAPVTGESRATLRHGLLTVRLPKPAAKARRVTVERTSA
jgi:HSP20 family protein